MRLIKLVHDCTKTGDLQDRQKWQPERRDSGGQVGLMCVKLHCVYGISERYGFARIADIPSERFSGTHLGLCARAAF